MQQVGICFCVLFSHRIFFSRSSPKVRADTVDTNTKKNTETANNYTVDGSEILNNHLGSIKNPVNTPQKSNIDTKSCHF